jgi:hypothetical protein
MEKTRKVVLCDEDRLRGLVFNVNILLGGRSSIDADVLVKELTRPLPKRKLIIRNSREGREYESNCESFNRCLETCQSAFDKEIK